MFVWSEIGKQLRQQVTSLNIRQVLFKIGKNSIQLVQNWKNIVLREKILQVSMSSILSVWRLQSVSQSKMRFFRISLFIFRSTLTRQKARIWIFLRSGKNLRAFFLRNLLHCDIRHNSLEASCFTNYHRSLYMLSLHAPN